jgi:hypothetical protein
MASVVSDGRGRGVKGVRGVTSAVEMERGSDQIDRFLEIETAIHPNRLKAGGPNLSRIALVGLQSFASLLDLPPSAPRPRSPGGPGQSRFSPASPLPLGLSLTESKNFDASWRRTAQERGVRPKFGVNSGLTDIRPSTYR